jgi:hypothetical protein
MIWRRVEYVASTGILILHLPPHSQSLYLLHHPGCCDPIAHHAKTVIPHFEPLHTARSRHAAAKRHTFCFHEKYNACSKMIMLHCNMCTLNISEICTRNVILFISAIDTHKQVYLLDNCTSSLNHKITTACFGYCP